MPRVAFSGPLHLLPERERRALLDRGKRALAEARVQVLPLFFDVRDNGDDALRRLTARFDGVELGRIAVEKVAWKRAAQRVKPDDREALELAAERISAYHGPQRPKGYELTAEGVTLGRKPVPLDGVGIYVPGGTASYPTTLLMAAVPARLAGVKHIVACTPPQKDGSVPDALLAAAEITGLDSVYAVGGAQAVFAMALGTKSVPAVQKIVGPGNAYVQAAKQIVLGKVGVDIVAGASEVLVIADGSQPAELAAWELAAQAEHAPDASAVLVAIGEEERRAVARALDKLIPELARADVITQALASGGALLSAEGLDDALAFANEFAPEHLVLQVEDARSALGKVRAAGSVFLGATPVALGDYAAGTNHVLPTSGAARFSSALGVQDFVRFIQWQDASPKGLERLAPSAARLARLEGLSGHAEAIEARLKARNQKR